MRIDWKKLIDELREKRVKQRQVADYVGVSYSTISAYKNGTEPRYCDGARLVFLHEEVVIKGMSQRNANNLVEVNHGPD